MKIKTISSIAFNAANPDAGVDTGDVAMNERVIRLLRRQREIEAEQAELSRELREISWELIERRFDEQYNEAWR
jgi:hypothetical protein